jgi:hypothetical protein
MLGWADDIVTGLLTIGLLPVAILAIGTAVALVVWAVSGLARVVF